MKSKIKKVIIPASPTQGEQDVQEQSPILEEHPSVKHPHGKSDKNKEHEVREHPHQIQTNVAKSKTK